MKEIYAKGPSNYWPNIDTGFSLPRELTFEPGDVLVSLKSLPDPNWIVDARANGEWGPGQTIIVNTLLEYLKFLELVVTNERIIACGINVLEAAPDIVENETIYRYFLRYYAHPYRE